MQLPSHLLITAFIDQHVSEKHVRKHRIRKTRSETYARLSFGICLTRLSVCSSNATLFGLLPVVWIATAECQQQCDGVPALRTLFPRSGLDYWTQYVSFVGREYWFAGDWHYPHTV